MHIYTRHGDDGRTLLLNGQRVWKDDPRVCVCGGVDELCSWLGVVAADAPATRPELAMQVRQVQGELFAVGAAAQLQGRMEGHPQIRPVGAKECARIEQWIDAVEAELPPLGGFIVPGGCRASAVTHVARSVCRRVERDMASLARTADAGGATVLIEAVAYLNRLADFLFVLARFCNRVANVDEPVLVKFDGRDG
ncbi:MAG: cob(I)yrinic acid a,c-diamide adenosyltransferase [bacterium]